MNKKTQGRWMNFHKEGESGEVNSVVPATVPEEIKSSNTTVIESE